MTIQKLIELIRQEDIQIHVNSRKPLIIIQNDEKKLEFEYNDNVTKKTIRLTITNEDLENSRTINDQIHIPNTNNTTILEIFQRLKLENL